MFETSTLGLFAMVIRVIGSILFILVLLKQIKLRVYDFKDNLDGLRSLLIGLTLIPFMFNFIAIASSYMRWAHEGQSETLTVLSFVVGAISSTATALILYIIYFINQNRQ